MSARVKLPQELAELLRSELETAIKEAALYRDDELIARRYIIEEQAKQVMAQRGIECDPVQFWAALNMIYSDYVKVAKKHGVGDKIDFYADMAKSFLCDKDAPEDKLARYYEYIVRA